MVEPEPVEIADEGVEEIIPSVCPAESQQNRQDCRNQQPPLFFALIEPQSQNEKENGNDAHVHGAGGKRLRPVIHWQGFGEVSGLPAAVSHFLQSFYGLGFIGIDCRGRGPSVEISHHQVRKFFQAVRPLCSIAEIKTGGLFASVGCQG